MRKWCAHYAAQPQRITSNVFYRFQRVVILVIYCTCKIHRLIFTKSKRLSAGVGNSLVAACSCNTAHSVSVSNILPGCDWFGEYRYYRCAVTCRQQMCTGHGRKPWTYGDVLFTWICIYPSAAEFGHRRQKKRVKPKIRRNKFENEKIPRPLNLWSEMFNPQKF